MLELLWLVFIPFFSKLDKWNEKKEQQQQHQQQKKKTCEFQHCEEEATRSVFNGKGWFCDVHYAYVLNTYYKLKRKREEQDSP